MLFNSLEFLIFFPIVFALYYLLPQKTRWFLLLVASYIFYGSWKVEYLGLIMLSTVIDYFCGYRMSSIKEKGKRKPFLYLSLFSNLGLLFLFKYLGFFTESINLGLSLAGIENKIPVIQLLLPVGISFYTFQTLSYTVDIYHGKMNAEKHFGRFALFVSFFPQLVAGPIERASHLVPQFRKSIVFNWSDFVSGCRLMLWGMFKKVVIADRLAIVVNEIYNNPGDYSGFSLVLGTAFFAFQIYCDFSGYSDIAIGAARTLGFDLMTNFRTPYFSKSVREFWQRWHISLSTWFRDYVYIPLGGNRVVKWRWYYNLFITFLISGLWHGAAWTFVIWGALHGIYLIIAIWNPIKKGFRKAFALEKVSLWQKFYDVSVVYVLVCFAWIFFRANSLEDAFTIIQGIFQFENYSLNQLHPDFFQIGLKPPVYRIDMLLSYTWFLFLPLVDYVFSNKLNFDRIHVSLRLLIYILGILTILVAGVYNNATFIYFQF